MTERVDDREEAWYREWFGDEYLRLYPHRDREEARRAVDLLMAWTEIGPEERILDLACGAGRHLESLRVKGLDAIGLDLSLPLLRRASEAAGAGREGVPPLVRADMRTLPFADGSFAAVSSFFTSFGYFDSELEDRRVVREIRRVLRPGGTLLLDFLNAQKVVRELRPRDENAVGGRRVIQERRLRDEDRVVEKRIRIEGAGDAPPREYRERVRLYRPAELEELLRGEGLLLRARFGDYDGGDWSPASPRVIILARTTP